MQEYDPTCINGAVGLADGPVEDAVEELPPEVVELVDPVDCAARIKLEWVIDAAARLRDEEDSEVCRAYRPSSQAWSS